MSMFHVVMKSGHVHSELFFELFEKSQSRYLVLGSTRFPESTKYEWEKSLGLQRPQRHGN